MSQWDKKKWEKEKRSREQAKKITKYVTMFFICCIGFIVATIIGMIMFHAELVPTFIFGVVGAGLTLVICILIDRYVKNRDNIGKIIAGIIMSVLVAVVILVVVALAVGDDDPRGDGKTTCRNCGRRPVTVMGYCEDCYEGFNDWYKDTYVEEQ